MIRLGKGRAQDIAYGALGIVAFLALWEFIGRNALAGLTWPPLSAVLGHLFDPARRALFLRASGASFSMVALGYIAGGAAGVLLAAVAHLMTPLREGLGRLTSV
ncbi:nitrate ABC transporter permease, partial [Rhizobiaceae sp. 2RAB30]